MKIKESRNNYITYLKEIEDTKRLVDQIKEALPPQDLVLVNCFPEYSSRITQTVNHKLSYLNENELFETLDLRMPYPNMSQVWTEGEYQNYEKYVADWVRTKINTKRNYLFVGCCAMDGSSFLKLRVQLRTKLMPENYKFAILYIQDNTIFTPTFYVQQLDSRPLFEWENADNPNWD